MKVVKGWSKSHEAHVKVLGVGDEGVGPGCRHGTGARGKLKGFIVVNKNHSNAGKTQN